MSNSAVPARRCEHVPPVNRFGPTSALRFTICRHLPGRHDTERIVARQVLAKRLRINDIGAILFYRGGLSQRVYGGNRHWGCRRVATAARGYRGGVRSEGVRERDDAASQHFSRRH